MNCLIVDDESVSREILTLMCQKDPNLILVDSFSNAIDAFRFLNKEEVDLIFVDVHMPDFTGFEFVQTLKNPPFIIITSSDKESALKAFDYESIIDFLKKPIDQERFKKAVLKAKKLMKGNQVADTDTPTEKIQEHFFINVDKRLIKINAMDVNFIEAKGDYIDINTEKETFRVHTTLTRVFEKLPKDIFFQVHRSFIINLTKIIDIQDNTILIQKSIIPIGRSKRADLMKSINLID
ncbi:LytTR family DNA-binding domain-containing protein [Algoriphagus sp. D3-2-R+10]|uniref:LytR/AlgR family response regulator transcription factor n=1 Tax=Algoriphagus aurantiacus TaxID=3103948 RepID=UPI002B38D36A|nr:LytTR family DNA-binding domain-containing protein [Algoriphagus sp. D3-2-R+10]MEB2778394.1 LytTR family DNA-binding domain-containing protein [Algoriphagus sp. D3-2-R+10]